MYNQSYHLLKVNIMKTSDLKAFIASITIPSIPNSKLYRSEFVISVNSDEYYKIYGLTEDETPFILYLEILDAQNINKLVLLKKEDEKDDSINFIDLKSYIEKNEALDFKSK